MRRRTGLRQRSTLLIVGALIGAAVVGGAAWSALSGTNELNACAQKVNGNLRLVAEADDCRRSERAVVWDVRGPVGPQGIPGPTGPKGEQGDPGAVGAFDELAGTACTPAPGLTGSIALVYEPNGDAKLNCDVGGALQTDPRNCGAIGNDVTRLPHATGLCVAGQPQITACDPGWFELGGNPSVGCDISAGAYEPNDTAAGGFQLRNHPSRLRAAISPAGEEDWYFFHSGFFACGQTEMSIFSKDDSVRFDLFLNGTPVAQNLTQHFGLGSLDGLLDIFVHAPAAGGYQLSFSRNFSTAC